MATGTVNLRYFILGLLAQQPMSGYDIKRFLKDLSWLIGSPSSGSLYPTLRILLQEKLVTVETIPGIDRPSKKIYSITSAGRQGLRAWTEQPVVSSAPLKAFVMRLLLASSLPYARLIAHLQQRRALVAAHCDHLGQAADMTSDGLDLGQHLAQDYGSALATAELAWLDAMLDRLSEQPLPQEVVEDQTPVAPGADLLRGQRQ